VATTTTDANGDYSFSGLPDGTYTVDVTDDANVLDGLWHSTGTPNTDDQSQTDPYTVSVSGGTTYPADFGYYGVPAALGDWVWADDGDGIQEAGELGLAGVVVQLTITWPDASQTIVKTVTDASGYYSFDNLLLDENYDGQARRTDVLDQHSGVTGDPSRESAGRRDRGTDSNNPPGRR